MKNTERLKELAKDYGLTGEDFYKDARGFVIITRNGVEKIQARDSIGLTYVTEKLEPDFVVIKAIAAVDGARVESYGEASPKNCKNSYFVAMAEKRAKARAILQLTQFYQLGVYSEDEIEDKQVIRKKN
jgi:hypothetical protein|tara:strand:+ start:808 stop:1194 length:387 start_codon:yes stop_codon:yes gene_type:complete